MTPAPLDVLHASAAFTRAGLLRPSRPDRALRAALALGRWGPTFAAGYIGAAARWPNQSAIVDELGTLTFAEVNSHTNAIANGLRERGVGAGDSVAIMCRNHRWTVETTVGCSKLGAHALYLNTAFAGPQVGEVLRREAPAAIVYDEEFLPLIDEHQPRLAFVGWEEERSSRPTLAGLIAASADSPLPRPAAHGRTVILTSGTTGAPRAANRASVSSLNPAAALLSRIPMRARQTTLIAAPIFHSWGFAHLALGAALAATLLLRRHFDPEATLAAIARRRARGLVVVPVMLQRILELGAPTIAGYDTSSLRVIAASGSALPGPLAAQIMDVFGDVLYNLYGSTEVAWATIAGPDDLRAAPGTAGRPPRGTVVKILDEDDNELPTGSTGGIFVGNELLFEGYTEGADKRRLGALMATGDVGHFDAAGRLFLDGRDDEMIVSGGENVFPSEVEDLLAHMPGVRDVAVIGVADAEFGERLRAFVVVHEGATLTEREIQDQARSQLARYKVPRDVIFVSELPRTATGKVIKRELRDRA